MGVKRNKKKTPIGDENTLNMSFVSFLKRNKKKTPIGDENLIKWLYSYNLLLEIRRKPR
ncbi:hypothetical protein GCWU000282_01837 [Catonella morbi ATCC 51271]|uniref:Uncharacterized protein n=1 Tax=Catonella morbi ATCC 51271 TaxID=592026 RepID=V2Y5J6_9FIRM|nr:hypothetical protein GCWU000282_01837 [Catonella morbi ATCC 51271]